jgi:plasmid stabilization system protein ParE
MAGVFLSERAKTDVKEIGRYTQGRWGVEQRNRYLGALDVCFKRLGANVSLGNSAEAIRRGYPAHSRGQSRRVFPQGGGRSGSCPRASRTHAARKASALGGRATASEINRFSATVGQLDR